MAHEISPRTLLVKVNHFKRSTPYTIGMVINPSKEANPSPLLALEEPFFRKEGLSAREEVEEMRRWWGQLVLLHKIKQPQEHEAKIHWHCRYLEAGKFWLESFIRASRLGVALQDPERWNQCLSFHLAENGTMRWQWASSEHSALSVQFTLFKDVLVNERAKLFSHLIDLNKDDLIHFVKTSKNLLTSYDRKDIEVMWGQFFKSYHDLLKQEESLLGGLSIPSSQSWVANKENDFALEGLFAASHQSQRNQFVLNKDLINEKGVQWEPKKKRL